MPTPTPNVRLAPVELNGSTLYNSYQFMTLVAALYTHGAAADEQPTQAEAWRQLSDLAIDDLGLLYETWEVIVKGPKPAGQLSPGDMALGRRVIRSCNRLDFVLKNISVWTPVGKVYQLLCFSERAWQRYLAQVTSQPAMAPVQDKLAQLAAGGSKRLGQLDGLLQFHGQEAARIQTCFSLVAQVKAGL